MRVLIISRNLRAVYSVDPFLHPFLQGLFLHDFWCYKKAKKGTLTDFRRKFETLFWIYKPNPTYLEFYRKSVSYNWNPWVTHFCTKVVFKVRFPKFLWHFVDPVFQISTNDFLQRWEDRCEIFFHGTDFSISTHVRRYCRTQIYLNNIIQCPILRILGSISLKLLLWCVLGILWTSLAF